MDYVDDNACDNDSLVANKLTKGHGNGAGGQGVVHRHTGCVEGSLRPL